MTRTEHLLFILAEECAEVAQRAAKAARFGLAEVQPGQPLTNARRLMGEMNDLLAVYLLIAGPVVSPTQLLFRGNLDEWQAALRAKQRRVEEFLTYSAECGTVQEGQP